MKNIWKPCRKSVGESGDKDTRLLLSYCKSHIYELHALLAATITLVAMHFVKKPVKEKIAETVEEKRNREPGKKRDWAGYRKTSSAIL